MARFRGSEAEAAGYGVDKLQGRPPSVGEFSSPGQFQILKELHSSAAGSVHLAKVKDPQSQLKDTVVLKKRKVPELGKAKDMFNEYEVMKRLSHPNIIRCYGYFWEFPTQSLYIVLEYANRGDLHGELQTRKRLGKHFSDNEVWDVLAQVLRGLRHIHARGIVHRDIKTMNLLLNDEGVIKLGDFGVSRQMSENTVCLHSFYGTPLYLSPELIEGRAYSRTTDIWSLGVVLYELLSLQLPFRGPSLQDVIAAVLRCRFSPLPSWRPQEFSDVVNSMLTKDAQRRPSAESLLQRMESLGKLFRPPKAVQEDPRPVEPKPPDKENRSPAAVARNEGHQVVRVRSRPSSAGPQVKLIEPDAPPPGATGPLHVVKNLREERWEQRRLAHAPAPYAVEKLQGRPSSIGEFNHREQFEILKDLQSNDSGSVHVARIKKGEELVVLKRRRAPELGKAKDVLNEYEIMKKLNHSNIIRCYGYFWDFPSQSLYIVLEYANRGDLHWELQKRKRLGKPFGDEEIWDILAQVLMGLCHIHARGIVHRDIKAMNLFLTSDGVIKLGDFGVSRQMSEKTLCLQSFYGTPLYFSPEMIEGQTYTNTTDIWSLGVVLYELLTLELPFKGKSLQDVIAAVLRGQYAPIPSYRPQEFSQIVSTMLTRDPAKRPTAEMLLRRLSRSGKLRANSAAAKMVEALSPEPSLSGDLRREPEFHGAAPRPLPPWETAEEVVRVRRRPASAGPQAKPPTKVPTPPVSDSSSGAVARPRDQRWEQRRQARFMESGTDQDSRDTDTTVEPGPVAPAGLTRPMPKAR